jgi:hypothetical protein
MDKVIYWQKQKESEDNYESRCKRCGACCGAPGQDACARLRCDGDGKYYCSVYAERIGLQKTVSGKEFHCVLIRDLGPNLPYKSCAYFNHG